ncbi:MAG: TonB-dependent receptor, partial [Acidobacteria bacterium]|nr:TonB-dependent receptor [Acidobacteriota bacterium]
MALLGGVNLRRHGDLRPGGGEDSRHVLRRFAGLSGQALRGLTGDRLQDTGFDALGWHGKLVSRLSANQFLTFRYQYADLGNVRSYKDLEGGLGRVRSDFLPQSLSFLYARYERLGWLGFDSVTGTVSLNSQRDGSVRQGLRLTDRITTDRSRVDSIGYIGQVTTHLGSRNAIAAGGEVYDERVQAQRDELDPLSGVNQRRRALYPNGSRYLTSGLFARDTLDIVRRQARSPLRGSFGARFTRIDYRTLAASNLDSAGRNLGVVDTRLSFSDLTWNGSLNWQPVGNLSVFGLVARGFRAPNLNDLGALGLNDLGYEVPALSAVSASGLVGSSDGEGVGTSGRIVEPLRPESLFNFESGVVWRSDRLTLRGQAFHATLYDPIVRRTLLFP